MIDRFEDLVPVIRAFQNVESTILMNAGPQDFRSKLDGSPVTDIDTRVEKTLLK